MSSLFLALPTLFLTSPVRGTSEPARRLGYSIHHKPFSNEGLSHSNNLLVPGWYMATVNFVKTTVSTNTFPRPSDAGSSWVKSMARTSSGLVAMMLPIGFLANHRPVSTVGSAPVC